MSFLGSLLSLLFGSGRNVVAETVELFRENAEAAGQREADGRAAALGQLAAEFARGARSPFDRAIDGLNRLPRPLMAYGILGLFVVAMVDPVWFAARMAGLAVVPEPLWWLMGAIVSFYFGARTQAHGQDFQRSIAETLARVPQVAREVDALARIEGEGGEPAKEGDAAPPGAVLVKSGRPDMTAENPALADWQAGR
ncbi:holin family protein [Wenxinia saemankumensis]|uniref:Holin of 3TMs, for gene-transfer release n=1 Tax=Wenxinia saemankumensis TaxID=1447782 RepID=A0A1M6D3I0_9RHOB|nr:holin family protein [Wenxinia saemankumensis]SHI67643.1 Holin of 3TMs, for gene-transfer release [Wenxinia saemankumensis]